MQHGLRSVFGWRVPLRRKDQLEREEKRKKIEQEEEDRVKEAADAAAAEALRMFGGIAAADANGQGLGDGFGVRQKVAGAPVLPP